MLCFGFCRSGPNRRRLLHCIAIISPPAASSPPSYLSVPGRVAVAFLSHAHPSSAFSCRPHPAFPPPRPPLLPFAVRSCPTIHLTRARPGIPRSSSSSIPILLPSRATAPRRHTSNSSSSEISLRDSILFVAAIRFSCRYTVRLPQSC
ncbi:hypothetical protein BO71DRAFT_237132 [Aspergillus ellipticus CBS 707.79]|uniref:Uncharacterized protein n=1 Tax=Aspergillus ellipticus CBS 707.79 TaxID=1448320 RepID=A0A319EEN5_9EURO|nr:hypothetical protein BO71DRAFT_237132 [Aspergillus ellipticus CBS 707.79]